jgi:Fe-S cluster assembly protein SufD
VFTGFEATLREESGHMATKASASLSMVERAQDARPHEPAWLRTLRQSAVGVFRRTGFPTTRDEEWRFTNVAPIADTPFVPAPPVAVSSPDAEQFLIPGLNGPVLVFVNGRFAPGLSRPGPTSAGVTISSLADATIGRQAAIEPYLGRYATIDDRPFTALNTASFEDGALIAVADGSIVEPPIQVLFLSTRTPAPAVSHPRVLAVLGRNSQVRVVEIFAGLGPTLGLTNAVAEFVVGDGAGLDHCRLQRESDSAFHIGHTQFHLGRASRLSSHAVTLGGLIARTDAVAVLADEGADCTLNGVYLAGGVQLVDNHTEIDHATPHGTSRELYKGILNGRARGVFNGRVRVRPDAQQTDAKQTNKTLLLSDDAQVNTKPQLEIFANDVKCTHGATVGQLSADALFFLRARGIGLDQARGMLVRAFATDVTSRIGLEPLRAEIDRLLAARLPGVAATEAMV